MPTLKSYPLHLVPKLFQDTPQKTIFTLHKAVIDSLNEPSLRDAYSKQGFEILGTTPEETASIMRQDYERWGPILSQLKLKLD